MGQAASVGHQPPAVDPKRLSVERHPPSVARNPAAQSLRPPQRDMGVSQTHTPSRWSEYDAGGHQSLPCNGPKPVRKAKQSSGRTESTASRNSREASAGRRSTINGRRSAVTRRVGG